MLKFPVRRCIEINRWVNQNYQPSISQTTFWTLRGWAVVRSENVNGVNLGVLPSIRWWRARASVTPLVAIILFSWGASCPFHFTWERATWLENKWFTYKLLHRKAVKEAQLSTSFRETDVEHMYCDYKWSQRRWSQWLCNLTIVC